MYASGTIVEHSIAHLRPTHVWSIDDGNATRYSWNVVSSAPGRLLSWNPVRGRESAYRYRLFDVDQRTLIADLGVVEDAGALRGRALAVAVDESGFIVRTGADEAALYSRDGALLERSVRLMDSVRAGAFASVDRLWSVEANATLVERDRSTGSARRLPLPAGAKTVEIRALPSAGLALIELYTHRASPSRAVCVDPAEWRTRWEQPSYFFMGVELANDERHVVLVPDPSYATVHDVRTGALLATGAQQSHWRIRAAHNGELLCDFEALTRRAVRDGALVESFGVDRARVRDLWIASDGSRLVSNHADGVTECVALSAASDELVGPTAASSSVIGETRAHRIVAEARDGRGVVLGYDDGAESVAFEWNGEDTSARFSVAPARVHQHSLVGSRDGLTMIAQSDAAFGVVALSMDAGRVRARSIPSASAFATVAFDEETKRVFLHKRNGSWEVSLAEETPVARCLDLPRCPPAKIVSIAANRSLVVYELDDASIEVVDLRSDSARAVRVSSDGRPSRTMAAPRATPVVARDADRFALVSLEQTRVSVHDGRGDELGAIEFAHGADVVCCCVASSDGSRIALATVSGAIHVFSIELRDTNSTDRGSPRTG